MEGLSNDFKEFRHDRPKVDKMRSAFRNNLGLIQKFNDTVQVVGNVASVHLEDKACTYAVRSIRLQAFPPAIPASLISLPLDRPCRYSTVLVLENKPPFDLSYCALSLLP